LFGDFLAKWRLVTRLDGGKRSFINPRHLNDDELLLGENLDAEMFNSMVKQLDDT